MFYSPLLSLTLGLYVSLPATATTITLYATHYSTSRIHTLSLTHSSSAGYSLSETSSLDTCGTYPSWVTFDAATRTLYCSDEYGDGKVNGSLTALRADGEGVLTELAVTGKVPGGGVHNVLFGEGGFLAVAHYAGSALSTYALPLQENADSLQVFEFELSTPGTNPDRQEAPHPHQTILDPTGKFVLVPDLGADLIRVFAVDESNGGLSACPSFNYTLGGGPRHGVFWTEENALKIRGRVSSAQTILYVVGELNNEVEAFAISYPAKGCLAFRQIDTEVPYPEDLPEGASLGEIRLADNNVYVSVRMDAAFDGDDSLAHLRRNRNGTLAFEETTSSYGVLPRTFAINKAGDLVAVGNQLSSNVAIVTRDPATGALGEVVADLQVGVPGEPNTLEGLSSIVWDE
ncbi:Lactonase, 7-bladed beta-propeller-domain-containing protein [Aspergillus cavernicola]|uniref:Lactonase, 7-bladed beta-propeller-domain-containing protein n=1 Tax=Aspergillus cavernicola TaxID=176166 RepID=A0ABR4HK49_9EURO